VTINQTGQVRLSRLFATACIALAATLLWQQSLATEWQSEVDNSQLNFAASFQNLPVNGRFKTFSVTCTTDQAARPMNLQVMVSVASADMGNMEFNHEIQALDWFNGADHSTAIFASDHFEIAPESKADVDYIAHGKLQLKGVERAVAVPFDWHQISHNQVAMRGELSLDRSDFGIGQGEWATGEQIGLAVRVWFDVRMLITDD
jgi:polyisoprenoid-binding protein YceI